MINLSTDIICLVSGEKLEAAFWEAVGVVRQYSSRPSCEANKFFFEYFKEDNESIEKIDEDVINCINEALSNLGNKNANADRCIRAFLATKKGAEKAAGITYVRKAGASMKLVLLHMVKQQVILLPHNFVIPWYELSREEVVETHFLTEITDYFKSFHKTWRAECPPISEALSNDVRRTQFAKQAFLIFNSCEANTFEEIDMEDIIQAWIANNRKAPGGFVGYTSTSIQFVAVMKAIDHHLPKDQAVFLGQFQAAKKPYEAANRSAAAKRANLARIATRSGNGVDSLKRARKLVSYSTDGSLEAVTKEYLYPEKLDSTNDDDVLRHALKLSRVFRPGNLRIALEKLNIAESIKEAALRHWLPIQEAHFKDMLRRKSGPTVTSEATRIGSLNAYLFYYLPIWFDNNQNANIEYPLTINGLKPSVFGSQIITLDKVLPRAMVDMLLLQRKLEKHKSNDTYNTYLRQINEMFEFASLHDEELDELVGGVKGVKPQLFTPSDRLKVTRRRRVKKRVFSGDLFPTWLSYLYAVKEYLQLLNSRNPGGFNHWRHRGSFKGRCVNLSDIKEVSKPIVHHFENQHQIQRLPKVFKWIETTKKDGITKSELFMGFINHAIVMQETGMRGVHVSWLDRRSFDSLVEDESSYMQTLFVNTDKTNTTGEGHAIYVADRVIAILREQTNWLESIEDSPIHNKNFYQNDEEGMQVELYGKIAPVFACDTENGMPISWSRYNSYWTELLLGFQWFLHDNGVDDISLVKYKGVGQEFVQSLPACDDDDFDANKADSEENPSYYEAEFVWGNYCPVVLRRLITPHGARATVVSENFTMLPPEIIGRYMTHQTTRVVFYYNSPDEARVRKQLEYANKAIVSHGDRPRIDDDSPLHEIAQEVNRKMVGALESDVDKAVAEYNLLSIETLLSDEKGSTGIEYVRHAKKLKIAKKESCLCPVNNSCPTELLDKFGEGQLCGICHLAINQFVHLDGISAAHDKAIELLDETKEKFRRIAKRKDVSNEEKHRIRKQIMAYAYDKLGYELRERAIIEMTRNKAVEKDDIILVELPGVVSKILERHTFDPGDESQYLAKRLRDLVHFPLSETPEIKARIEATARKYIARKDGVDAALNYKPSPDGAAKELRSLILSIQKAHNIPSEKVIELISEGNKDGLVFNEARALLEVDGE